MAIGDETFAGMVDTISAELSRRDDESLAQIRLCVARKLAGLSRDKFLFTEATYDLTLVVGQDEYERGSTPTTLPPYLMYVDVAHWKRSGGTREWPLEKIGITEMRQLQSCTRSPGKPSKWTWHHNRWIVWPKPSMADVIQLDYHVDSTLSDSGTRITHQSNTETNIWFQNVGGEGLLRPLAAEDFCLAYMGDPGRASTFTILHRAKKAELTAEYNAMILSGGTFQAAWSLDRG